MPPRQSASTSAPRAGSIAPSGSGGVLKRLLEATDTAYMSRALVLSVATALACLGAGAGAFLAGRNGGPDLALVARAAAHAGASSGRHSGSAAGFAAGYKVGYRGGYHHAYSAAYGPAYRRAVGVQAAP